MLFFFQHLFNTYLQAFLKTECSLLKGFAQAGPSAVSDNDAVSRYFLTQTQLPETVNTPFPHV